VKTSNLVRIDIALHLQCLMKEELLVDFGKGDRILLK
jgi:hypothetical protein